jgi:hypothetical protein
MFQVYPGYTIRPVQYDSPVEVFKNTESTIRTSFHRHNLLLPTFSNQQVYRGPGIFWEGVDFNFEKCYYTGKAGGIFFYERTPVEFFIDEAKENMGGS